MDRTRSDETLQFDCLEAIDPERLPNRESYTARDGTDLNYRTYPSSADLVFVCMALVRFEVKLHVTHRLQELGGDLVVIEGIHGSGGESRYLQPLGSALSDAGVGTVVTPDLRGHGADPVRRRDVDYVGPLEDDVADLVEMLREAHPSASIIVGDRSSSGWPNGTERMVKEHTTYSMEQ